MCAVYGTTKKIFMTLYRNNIKVNFCNDYKFKKTHDVSLYLPRSRRMALIKEEGLEMPYNCTRIIANQ